MRELSKGRLSAITSAMEYHGSALPRTPFATSWHSPQGETRIFGGELLRHMIPYTIAANPSLVPYDTAFPSEPFEPFEPSEPVGRSAPH